MSSKGSSDSSSLYCWTVKQNKAFERALATYDKETPERWHNIARVVGDGKTVDDIKRHYQVLLDDLRSIENGQIPLPNYRDTNYEEQRIGNLRLS